MREIKFRVIKNNKIVGEISTHPCFNGGVFYQVDFSLPEDERIMDSKPGYLFPSFKDDNDPLERYTYEQYTGLKDKNGKEIYEGDICQFSRIRQNGFHCAGGFNKSDKVETFKGIISFNDGAFCISDCNCYNSPAYLHEWAYNWTAHTHIDRIGGYDNAEFNNFEIIGNIHENKDLL